MMREKFGNWLFARSLSRVVSGTMLRSQRAGSNLMESKVEERVVLLGI